MDPYKVLGISRDATDEEVKKAYRDLARKYHPDNYVNNPLADLVEEKMKEINEAYELIQKERAGRPAGNYQGGAQQQSYAGSDFSRIHELMHAGRYAEAELMLDAVTQAGRNAEWNYLKGCVLLQRGWLFDAQKHLEAACYMDPGNLQYRNVLSQIRSGAGNYGTGYRTAQNTGDCSGCDMCTSLMCADCLCECMGGDLIHCC